MKNFTINLLVLICIPFLLTAQKQIQLKSNWVGDNSAFKIEHTQLKNPLVNTPNKCFHIQTLTRSSISRKCYLSNNSKTIWGSILAVRKKGTGRFGLALEEGLKEKLFVDFTKNTPTLFVFRIDFSKAGDKAYIFHNPSVASVPDVENAEYTYTGDFSFDQIRFIADKGIDGLTCDVQLGDSFNSVVSPKSIEERTIKGSSQQILSWKNNEKELWIQTTGGTLYMQPYKIGSLHVMFGSSEHIKNNISYAVTETPEVAKFHVQDKLDELVLQTDLYSVSVNKKQGFITLKDAGGKSLIHELPGEARVNIQRDSVLSYCKFKIHESDALYGLGQFRDKCLNLRNTTRELIQFNTQAAVPVLYSTGGWGIFWDNPARTIFKDDATGMSFYSDYGTTVNYYLFVGKTLDNLVASYRNLTGRAPLLPDWALGYHQSRNKYSTQREVLDIAKKMKEHDLKMSTIFVDYYYWQKYGTGSHRFDEELFPDVKGMLDSLHRVYNTRLVITMWPTFNSKTENYKKMDQAGFLLNGARALDGIIYDPFNPAARKMYWEQVLPLVNLGVDGWFLDGPEPDVTATFLPRTTFAGPAVKVRNLYPLVHSSGFYEGILKARPNLRPYILTRCAWAAQQRVGTAIWSGDIPTTFDELETQITAGLNFTATGIPYWTTDIGGYSGGNPADKDYQEVFARWFEYGTFCPVFRAHGRRYPGNRKTSNEPWAYGSEVETICRDFINLRYRLYPYIYSLGSKITMSHYTPMRLLAFDFPSDKNVLDCKDQFMYGPSILVCPVIKAGARKRKVYLPQGSDWTNFFTSEHYTGGQTIEVEAPLNQIPLFIRSGSILPMYQDSNKNLSDNSPIDIYLYSGADGSFDLYEDDGSSLEYQKGKYKIIHFEWNDAGHLLSITTPHSEYLSNQTKVFNIHYRNMEGKMISKRILYKNKKLNLNLKDINTTAGI